MFAAAAETGLGYAVRRLTLQYLFVSTVNVSQCFNFMFQLFGNASSFRSNLTSYILQGYIDQGPY